MDNYLLMLFCVVGLIIAIVSHQNVRHMTGFGNHGMWSESSSYLVDARKARFDGVMLTLLGVVLCVGVYFS